MSNFISLATMLEGWFEKPLRDLAEELRQRITHDFFPTPWDDLAPDQRRSVARQWDYQHDPDVEPDRQFWLDFTERKNAIERQIDKWKAVDTPTASELAQKETRLAVLGKELALMEQEQLTRFIAYPKALKLLVDRLEATQDEMAAWVWMEPEDGGLAAYLNANELDPPPRFYYDIANGHGFDYLAPLMACWFRSDDIANFQPSDRYITGEALIERWEKEPNIQPEAFIRAKIAESRLMDIYPIFGGTQGSFLDDELYPPLERGLYVLCHVEKIEAEDFPNELTESTEKLDSYQSTDDDSHLPGQNPESELTEGKNENITPPCKESQIPSTDAQDKVATDNDDTDSIDNELSEVFDPLPLSGIAKMFPLDPDEQINHGKWRNHAGKASRNGLQDARKSVGRGNAESTFDPWSVAEWLIDKGFYARDKAERKLANNLPPQSAHLKDLILP